MHPGRLLAGLLAASLSLAGCGASANPTSSPEPSAEASTVPSTQPGPPGSLVILGVTVHWNGTQCIYRGDPVIRDGTTIRVEYTFDDGTDPPLLFIGGVVPGTTWDTFVDYVATHPASEAPPWVILSHYALIDAGTSALYTIDAVIAGRRVGGYAVGCATAPANTGGTDTMYPAALLLIAGP